MAEDTSTLAAFYQGWHDYQKLLTEALAPLSSESLTLRAAPHQRSLGEIVLHMVATRAGWFYEGMGEGGKEFAELSTWDLEGAPQRTSAELVQGLETTWRIMQGNLARWTPEDMCYPYKVEEGNGSRIYTRQWVIWHLIEHDLHHGGEVSLILGIHGLQAPAL